MIAGFLGAVLLCSAPALLKRIIRNKVESAIQKFEARTGFDLTIGEILFPETGVIQFRGIMVRPDSSKTGTGLNQREQSDEIPPLIQASRITVHTSFMNLFRTMPVDSVIIDTITVHMTWDTTGLNVSPLGSLFLSSDTLSPQDSAQRKKTSYLDKYLPSGLPNLTVRSLNVRFSNEYAEFIPGRKLFILKKEIMSLENGQMSLKTVIPGQMQFELKGTLVSQDGQTRALISGHMNSGTRQIMLNTLLDRSFKLPFLSRWLDMDVALKGMDMIMNEAESDSGRDHLDFQVMIHDLALTSGAVASKKIQGLDIQAGLNLDIEAGKITVNPQTHVGMGQIRIFVSGTITNPDHQPDYRLMLKLDTLSMDDFFMSVPPVFMTRLEGIRVRGRMSYELNFRLNTAMPDCVQVEPSLSLSRDFRVVTLGDSVNIKKYRDDFEHAVLTEDGKDSVMTVGKDNPYYVPYDSIPKHLVHAVLFSEDGSFFRNDGFNVLQIEKSVAENLRQKKFVRGASTISMQWVKNLFLSREKTLSRKFQELILTWLINRERMLDEHRDKERHKKRLLEIYLNIIEWGPDIYGIGRASEFYFRKRPSTLSVNESAFLATIIPNPKKYERYFYRGQLRKNKKTYMNLLARKMAGQQIISHAESLEAEDSPLLIPGEAMSRILHATRGDTVRFRAEDD